MTRIFKVMDLWGICMPRAAHVAGVLLLLGSGAISMNGQPVDFTYRAYGLAVDGDNEVQNVSHLDDFYARLYQLQQAGDRKVNIVHIGDSHIQADYMTCIIRRNFHRHFGNAGRGLVVPLRVARTNEPNNFKTSSNVIWKSKRCVFPENPLPIGIGGVTIESADETASLDIFMNDLWLDYRFNALTLFYEEDEEAFDFTLSDREGGKLGKIETHPEDSTRNYARIEWEKRLNAVSIQSVKNDPKQRRAMIYGAVLENSMPGVLYHTIGVNGARFRHYREAKYFAEQTAALRADLFVISLGTNESIDYPHVGRNVLGEIEALLSKLKAHNPKARFILVTPQEVFRQRNKPNPGIMQIRELIIRYAVENGLAFYDMFRAMGGEHSAGKWSENALLSKDGIHLTREGYEYQGNLFYHAIMKGYSHYVRARHQ